jgi:hypothetical protein
MPRTRVRNATPGSKIIINLIDVGPQAYGDCILCQFGDISVLIDGAHAANTEASFGHRSTRVKTIFGRLPREVPGASILASQLHAACEQPLAGVPLPRTKNSHGPAAIRHVPRQGSKEAQDSRDPSVLSRPARRYPSQCAHGVEHFSKGSSSLISLQETSRISQERVVHSCLVSPRIQRMLQTGPLLDQAIDP